ncbi:MAG: glutamate synthase subunit alpha, partial [Gallionella sp.]|nr:glutamate synthase subunit alpha [Gallionella sp.]
KAKGLDFTKVFHQPKLAEVVASRHVEAQDHGLSKALDHQILRLASSALEKGIKVNAEVSIKNINRTAGAMLSGRVAEKYGAAGLPDDTIHIRLNGTAGQSFAAFLAKGITFDLVGEANDYVGKGLSGGRIIVRPPRDFGGQASENIIVGNTVLYGATQGEAFFAGVAGERFCVRNSGATAVVEGAGDHGCEYMTGGTVVVLGATGRNFAAGMSGGIAYVYDEEGGFRNYCNSSMVVCEEVPSAAKQRKDAGLHNGQSDELQLKSLIERHARYTESVRAQQILADWESARGKFVKVFPHEYRRALQEIAAQRKGGK